MRKLMLLFGLSLLFIYGCSNDDDDYVYVTTTIEVLPDSIEFQSGADSSYISVFINTIYTNNLLRWSATSNQTWCTVIPQYNLGSGKVKVKVSQNNTTQKRVAYVTIHPAYTDVYLRSKIIQEGNIP